MNAFSKYVVLLKGGIGNQLFQYAYAKYLLSVENKNVATYFLSKKDNYNRINIIKNLDPSIYLTDNILDRFIIRIINKSCNISIIIIKIILYIMGLMFQIKLVGRSECTYKLKGLNKQSLIKHTKDSYYIRELDKRGLIILKGYWQSAEMVNLVKNDLLEKLNNDQINASYDNIKHQIDNHPNAVAIHIRSNWSMGYASDNKTKPNTHNQETLSREYYIRAIQNIQKRGKPIFFFIFVDDTKKASIFIESILPKEDYLMIPNYENIHDDYAALMLMSHCKHFIISNSTFGWWGAWLSYAQNKKINHDAVYIMPNRWNKNDQDGHIAQRFKFSPQCIMLEY